ncbi:MAG: hypothetical protein RBG1_1C00001G0751 [candidate division Zixibacteria bacterium RBG-1]|nr:MAG: hypothetical protein RBG1_1C00001G0751 [candidate division Zixibacteria bacterium RBG-1]
MPRVGVVHYEFATSGACLHPRKWGKLNFRPQVTDLTPTLSLKEREKIPSPVGEEKGGVSVG